MFKRHLFTKTKIITFMSKKHVTKHLERETKEVIVICE